MPIHPHRPDRRTGRHRTRPVLALVVLGACLTLAACGSSASNSTSTATLGLASGSLSGTYRTTVTTPASLKGTWSFRFADGRDSQLLNGNEVANGTYTISGSTVKFADPAIPKGAVPPSSSGTSTTPPAGAPAGAPSLPSGTTSPTACKTPGTYKVTISGETLTFKKISDPCNAPRAQLLSHKFTKA
jgi:hypothetical protein